MKKKNIILVGAGGHAKVCIDVIEREKKFQILGLIDNKKKGYFLNYKILGTDKELKKIFNKVKFALISVGHLYKPQIRQIIFKKLKKIGYNLPVIKSPYSIVSKYSSIGEGTIIMHSSIVNSGSKVGKNCILNSMSLIEHDVSIGDYTHISTNTVINGQSSIGKNCFVGSSSVVTENIKIKDNSFIKANSFIKKNN